MLLWSKIAETKSEMPDHCCSYYSVNFVISVQNSYLEDSLSYLNVVVIPETLYVCGTARVF